MQKTFEGRDTYGQCRPGATSPRQIDILLQEEGATPPQEAGKQVARRVTVAAQKDLGTLLCLTLNTKVSDFSRAQLGPALAVGTGNLLPFSTLVSRNEKTKAYAEIRLYEKIRGSTMERKKGGLTGDILFSVPMVCRTPDSPTHFSLHRQALRSSE